MLFTLSILSTLLFSTSISAIEITQNRVDHGTITTSIGDITIDSGAYWSIIDNSISTFIGNLDIKSNAGLYISLTILNLPLLVLLNSGSASITNDGIVSLDARTSTQGSSQFNLVGGSFENNGEFYLAASGAIPMTMGLTGKSWNNNGLIVAYQNERSSGSVKFGVIGQTITNKGQICLTNQVYQQTSKIDGSGCVTAKKNASIYISNVLDPQSVSTEQNYFLADDQSSIITQAVGFNTQVINVFGFGNGNKIGLTLPLKSGNGGQAYSYDSDSGVLSLSSGLFGQKFNIGPGYDSKLFSIVTDNSEGIPSVNNGAVSYSGPVPSQKSLPSACNVECKPVPNAPDDGSSSSSTVASSTTSTTSTDSASLSSTSGEESSASTTTTESSETSNTSSNASETNGSSTKSETTGSATTSEASETANSSESSETSGASETSQSTETSESSETESSVTESSETDSITATTSDTTSSGNDNSSVTSSSDASTDSITSETASSSSTPLSGDSSQVSSLTTGTSPDTIAGSQTDSTSSGSGSPSGSPSSSVVQSSGVTNSTPNTGDVNTQSNTANIATSDNTATSTASNDTGVNTATTTGTGTGPDNNNNNNNNNNNTNNSGVSAADSKASGDISTVTASSTTLISVASVSSTYPIANESSSPSSSSSGTPGEVIPSANGSSKLSIGMTFMISGFATMFALFM